MLWELSASISNGELWFPDHCFSFHPLSLPSDSDTLLWLLQQTPWLTDCESITILHPSFAMWLCSFSHQDTRSSSLLLEAGLAWWLALANRSQWRWSWASSEASRGLRCFYSQWWGPAAHGNKSGLACWRMRDHVEESPVAQLRPS